MFKKLFLLSYCFLCLISFSAQAQSILTIEKIMQDPRWIGSSPSGIAWSQNSSTLFFNWNPDQAKSDSLYFITPGNQTPQKASVLQKQELADQRSHNYNLQRTAFVSAKGGDIYLTDLKTGKRKRITHTTDAEMNPVFSFQDTRIVFTRNQNLYAWDMEGGEIIQLTNFRTSEPAPIATARTGSPVSPANQQEQWLKNDQLKNFQVLRERKEKQDATRLTERNRPREKELRSISLDDKSLQGLAISPDGRFITYRLMKAAGGKTSIVPNYVTESGFTTDIPSRSKVGAPQGTTESFFYDRQKDTIYRIIPDSIPGIRDIPDYLNDYPEKLAEKKKKASNRIISVTNISWSPAGSHAVAEIRSQDNKDRWLMLFDTASGKLKLLDRQHDDAWIGGPGTSGWGNAVTGWIGEHTFWYRSEATGFSHLYTVHVLTGEKKGLTNGAYEVQQAQLSADKKYFYISTNEVHPGEQHFYRLSLADGKKERLTSMTGANQVTISPDEKWMAILHSYSNRPWELYFQEISPAGKKTKSTSAPSQVTDKAQSPEFKAYTWRDPEVITFTARDGAHVYARLYKPANPHPNKPAVLFVHGAGYLQNAHKWWSSYFREFMFNNLLADQGYYVMDIDYRGSAGYGRDWRTGIYRHMGGKDLSDHVDAVRYMVKNYGVSPGHVGLYGGSYGGFISLMGMFTEPDVFAAGAALRPVTDWANYNHGYTSNILNEPFMDSLAYRKSSPIYFAEGLKGHLLICHGMVDVNVHYQDAVKLTQRLIELGKDDWELASYPMEDHGFTEPSSWTDEYKRIFKLFETVLKK